MDASVGMTIGGDRVFLSFRPNEAPLQVIPTERSLFSCHSDRVSGASEWRNLWGWRQRSDHRPRPDPSSASHGRLCRDDNWWRSCLIVIPTQRAKPLFMSFRPSERSLFSCHSDRVSGASFHVIPTQRVEPLFMSFRPSERSLFSCHSDRASGASFHVIPTE